MSILNELEQTLSLMQECDRIKMKNNFENFDTRSNVLNNINIFSSVVSMNLSLLLNWSTSNRILVSQIVGLEEPDKEKIKILSDRIHQTMKVSLSVLGMFQIENCIQNINNALILPNKKGFFEKAQILINHLNIDSEKFDVLHAGSLIRNSLHSNGIHHGYQNQNFEFKIDNIEYKFNHNQKVECCHLSNVIQILIKSINILDEIFNHPKLESINIINDEYAKQVISNQ